MSQLTGDKAGSLPLLDRRQFKLILTQAAKP
jgi:hypothetical protein